MSHKAKKKARKEQRVERDTTFYKTLDLLLMRFDNVIADQQDRLDEFQRELQKMVFAYIPTLGEKDEVRIAQALYKVSAYIIKQDQVENITPAGALAIRMDKLISENEPEISLQDRDLLLRYIEQEIRKDIRDQLPVLLIELNEDEHDQIEDILVEHLKGEYSGTEEDLEQLRQASGNSLQTCLVEHQPDVRARAGEVVAGLILEFKLILNEKLKDITSNTPLDENGVFDPFPEFPPEDAGILDDLS